MAFSRAQQIVHFRPMVADAWRAHCAATLGPKDTKAKDLWYRAVLRETVNKSSTKDCDPRGDFEHLMARFEEIAGNGITWQLKLEGGTKRRIIHKIHAICAENHLEENYVRRIARQELRLQTLPLLERLETAQLLTLLKMLRCECARITAAAHKDSDIDIPF